MSNLLRAEFLRLVSRRLTWALLFVTVAFGALVALASAGEVRPQSPDDHAQAEQQYREYMSYFDDPECSGSPGNCGSPEDLTVADFLRVPVDYEPYLTSVISTAPLVLVATTVLASLLIGSEFSSGSLSTQLMFTPRRRWVMTAKVAAASAGAVGLMFAFIASVMTFGTITFLLLRGGSDVVASVALPLRFGGLLLATFATALLAASLTFGLGSSGLALGAGVVVLVASEMYVGSSPHLRLAERFMPNVNLGALMGSDFRYTYWDPITEAQLPIVTFGWAAVYALVLVAVVTAVCVWVFPRRDLLR